MSQHQRIAAMFATYFQMGGQQLQVNVVDARTLRAAQAHPEEYRGLIVRVGGFSARFNDLERALQDDIIARTEHR
jgi:formate C-acetyltransferase